MKIHSIRKKLREDKRFNPFHDDFNQDEVRKELKAVLDIDEVNKQEEDSKLAATLEASFSINIAFKESYEYLRNSFNKVNLTYKELIGFSMAIRNRVLYLIFIDNIKQYDDSEGNKSITDFMRFKIDSFDSSIGKIDSQAALETEVDSLNLILNYLRYFKDQLPETNPQLPKVQSIDQITAQGFASIFLYILKSAYEDAIWKDGFVGFDDGKRRMDIEYFNPKNLVLHKIGVFRLERNAMSFFIVGLSFFKSNGLIPDLNLNKHKNPEISLSGIRITSGFLKFSLSKKKDEQEFQVELSNESALMAYYDFLVDVDLPNLKGFTIKKVLGAFTLLMHLFKKAREMNIHLNQTSVYKKSDLYKYPFRIKAQDLISYLDKRSNLSEGEINSFIQFIQAQDRINLWNEQLFRIEDDYYFLLLPLASPNILYLIDLWLEKGGIILTDRGPYFEKFVKNRLDMILKKKGYYYQLINKSKFKNSKNQSEEIDLVLCLKNIIIVAELKCIRFPFEPREISNSFSRLQKGAEQVRRKINFLEQNRSDFESDIPGLEAKDIVPLVICNYPIFTGMAMADVQIVDFFLVEAYISSGKLERKKIGMLNGKVEESETIDEVIFYKNEDEFSDNFIGNMTNPPAVEDLKSIVEIKTNKITPDNFNYQVYIQAAEFKEP